MATEDLQQLVAAAVDGDANAWDSLWTTLHPRLLQIASSPRVTGRLSQDEDECRNIVVEVMARLCDDDFRRLKLFQASCAANPELSFLPWLTVVAKRVAIDYLRGHGEYIDRRRSRTPKSAAGRWMQRKTLPGNSRLYGARPAMTNHGAAMAMLRYAYKDLPADQLRALEQWVIGNGFEDIAAELELDHSKAAEKLVRAALQKLRRRFRSKGKA